MLSESQVVELAGVSFTFHTSRTSCTPLGDRLKRQRTCAAASMPLEDASMRFQAGGAGAGGGAAGAGADAGAGARADAGAGGGVGGASSPLGGSICASFSGSGFAAADAVAATAFFCLRI